MPPAKARAQAASHRDAAELFLGRYKRSCVGDQSQSHPSAIPMKVHAGVRATSRARNLAERHRPR